MQSDNIYYLNREEKDKFISGIEKTCEVVEGTYGAAGGNSIVEHELYPYHVITNDGKTMMDAVRLDDRFEKIGSNFMKEAGGKADKDSGDGRKTTAILTRAIIREARNSKELPMVIKKSLDECVSIIHASIDSEKRDITPDSVRSVATIASENERIGELLQEIYQKIGKDGIVELDNSNTFETFYEIKDGVRFRNAGFISPYMANEGTSAVYKKPSILITKQKISTINDLDSTFRKLVNSGISECVVYCDSIDASVVDALAFTHSKGIFKTLIIKAPTLWKDWFFEDFAKITGATIVEPASGVTLKNVELSHLGTCEKIITTKEETTVIGFKDVSEHIARLLSDNTDESKLRASWLNGKAAILKLGANSESELSYISKKAKDGRNASALALKDGVVVGGGISLINAISKLPDTIGGNILKKALLTPTAQIVKNFGEEQKTGKRVLMWLLNKTPADSFGGTKGFDALNGKMVDMWEANIIDPAIVVKNAVKNAISVAGTAITARSVIALPVKEKTNENTRQMPIM
jgi:chaperonin GroEL